MCSQNKKENPILSNNQNIISKSKKKKYFKKFFKFFFFYLIFIFFSLILLFLFALVHLSIQGKNLKKLKQSSILNGLTLAELENKKNKIEDKMKTLDEDIKKIKENFKKYELKEKMEKEFQNTQGKVRDIEREIVNIEGKIKVNKEDIEGFEREITNTEGKIKANKEIIEKTQVQITNTKKKITENEQKIREAEEEIKKNERKIREVEEEIQSTSDPDKIEQIRINISSKRYIINSSQEEKIKHENLNKEQKNFLNKEQNNLKNSQKELNLLKQIKQDLKYKLKNLKDKLENLKDNLTNLKDKLKIQSKHLTFFKNMKTYLERNEFKIDQYNKDIYNVSISLSVSDKLNSNHVLDINDLYSKLLEKEFLNRQKYLIELYKNSKKLKNQQEQKLNFQNLEYEALENKRYEVKKFIIRIDMILNSLEYYFQFYHDSIQKNLDKRRELHLFVNRKKNFFDNVKYHFNLFCQLIKKRELLDLEKLQTFNLKKLQEIKFELISFNDIRQMKDSLKEISTIEIDPETAFELNNENKNKAQVEKIDTQITLQMLNKKNKIFSSE